MGCLQSGAVDEEGCSVGAFFFFNHKIRLFIIQLLRVLTQEKLTNPSPCCLVASVVSDSLQPHGL